MRLQNRVHALRAIVFSAMRLVVPRCFSELKLKRSVSLLTTAVVMRIRTMLRVVHTNVVAATDGISRITLLFLDVR